MDVAPVLRYATGQRQQKISMSGHVTIYFQTSKTAASIFFDCNSPINVSKYQNSYNINSCRWQT